ncbi:hypothetical protein [Changchengzhania lutea]|uniref:hypothetical protein n=1 Tax=Changchengzhania lutea TaxID=2049305 RepID=UPI00163D56DD|nr:hypothetical protein [Changchengzhania lutea]
MNFTDQHKAVLLTFLISGTVVLSVFNFNLKQKNTFESESYYQVEPEQELTEEDIKVLEALEQLNASKAETNQAFNESQDKKHFAQAYKPIAPPEDFKPATPSESDEGDSANTSIPPKDIHEPAIDEADISSFSKVNDLLKKQQSEGVNKKSTIRYSLVGRTHQFLPTPVYLCETGGKIVINITVNSRGKVTDAYVNSSSTSSNECLKEHALEYANKSKFSADASKDTQLGSITFYFIGKS